MFTLVNFNFLMLFNIYKETVVSNTFLTTDQLAERIQYDARTIREQLKDSVLIEGIHYVRPFGRRKILYIWEKIETDILNAKNLAFAIPMANGGVCNG
ncbi:MAG: hypothetical protein Q8K02_16120 [Flavobacterium sp.]|nr:hypothetical protein [Flavobacterium sp.]